MSSARSAVSFTSSPLKLNGRQNISMKSPSSDVRFEVQALREENTMLREELE